MTAYFNEIDPYAAQWLKNLISAGEIAAGDVDERSIRDVPAGDLVGYSQCHFFAGIGGWSYALRLAGWADDRPVWTGSCPCQPFSEAGKGMAFEADDHLWPDWFRLIRERRPATIFGEQAPTAIRWGWLDAVANDLEAIDYAFGAAALPACAVRSYQIRERTWFLAHSASERGVIQRRQPLQEGGASARPLRDWPAQPDVPVTLDGIPGRMAYVRGFGNCIHPWLAAEFIEAASEVIGFY